MAITCVQTACIEGSRVLPVTVEVDLQPGLPQFSIIGLPDKRIDEARERVKAAFKNSGLAFPLGKITVNLAPSSRHKQGTGFDLAIAVGILVASTGQFFPENLWFLGELSLSGLVQPYQHIAAVLIEAARREVGCVIPASQEDLASLVEGCAVFPVQSLTQLVTALNQRRLRCVATPAKTAPSVRKPLQYKIDSLVGQEEAKRALLVALAGRHNLLLSGPPGAGKTMLAEAATELLPPLTKPDLLTLAQLHAYANQPFDFQENARPPFRTPHASLTRTALLGGGTPLVPGELSLAHAGVLFLDEFAEMARPVRDALRQPLEEKKVVLIRHGERYRFPAACLVIAAQNSCPCGRLGVEGERCTCTPGELARYESALSEPILDRFQLFCALPKLPTQTWSKEGNVPADLTGKEMVRCIHRCRKTAAEPLMAGEARNLLLQAVDKFHLSGRAFRGLAQVAKTIAKIEEKGEVAVEHMQEALQYRRRPLLLR